MAFRLVATVAWTCVALLPPFAVPTPVALGGDGTSAAALEVLPRRSVAVPSDAAEPSTSAAELAADELLDALAFPGEAPAVSGKASQSSGRKVAGPQRKENDGPSDEARLRELRTVTQAKIVDALRALNGAEATFLEHRHFSIAARFFQTMREGATNMLDTEGVLSQQNVDKFHNHADETLRCLAQLIAQDIDERWFGAIDPKVEQQVRKKMSVNQQKAIAADMTKELLRLKKMANDVPGLEEVRLASVRTMDGRQFQAHLVRVLVKIDVVLYSHGLGVVYNNAGPAKAELCNSLNAIRSTTDRLVDLEGEVDPKQLKALGSHLQRGIENADILSQKFPPMKSKSNGARGALIRDELEGLKADCKSFERTKDVR